jgi:hypothetical protein
VALPLIEKLLASPEPSIRWKLRTQVLGEAGTSPKLKAIGEEIRKSARVRTLLSRRDRQGRLSSLDVYSKWQGAHWVMASLADLGYPQGDQALFPLRDQLQEHWLDPYFFKEFKAKSKADARQKDGVPLLQGRHRRCGSQQGNALYTIVRLGLADRRTPQLAERLVHWRWPDGGWNCDKEPSASHSSFTETLLPMKGLYVFAVQTRNAKLKALALDVAEVFLKRRLFKRLKDGKNIHSKFMSLHYPLYWHYDVLGGLKAMAEMGLAKDKRCAEALDWLEARQLPGGGWPAEGSFHKVSGQVGPDQDDVDWGGTSKKRLNEWVSADALFVLKSADRI